MKTNILLAFSAAMVATVNLSSCASSHDEVGYRYEHGDRIAPDGKRDVGWCLAHASNEHCRRSIADSQ